MPGDARGRLLGQGAAPTAHGPAKDLVVNSNVCAADDIVAQLRRRREAAKRLPPLASGKRDPWDLESYYDPARGA
jgi:hypothetical protein